MISNNLKKRLLTSILLFILLILIFKFNLILVYCLIILSVVSILEFLQLTKKIAIKPFSKIMLNILFMFYIFSFCLIFLFFSYYHGFKIILYITLLGCIASDIGGFIFGKLLKGPKLTRISPNKTYSGSFGSIISSIIIVLICAYYFFGYLNLKILIIGAIISVLCQIGDLLFSFLKRKAKVKDTGNFFPGHGGVLDRLDGIFLGVPFGLVIFILIF